MQLYEVLSEGHWQKRIGESMGGGGKGKGGGAVEEWGI